MGRVERRKQNKKNKIVENNIKETTAKEQLITALKIIIAMFLILFVLYFVVAVYVTKEIDLKSNKKEDTEETETSSISDKILAKNTFNQKEESYYVYFYDFNNEDKQISNHINNLNEEVYKVDTSNSLNKNYVTEEEFGNKNATNIDELKVINPTLIKVTNDKIVEYYEKTDSIVAYLNK